MKKLYVKFKHNYYDYILLIKNGNFYICLNQDAFVLSNIFNFKIIESKNFLKSGFPISSIDRVLNILTKLSVNYIIIDKEVVEKEKFDSNNYNEYINNGNFINNLNRINKISEVLKTNLKYNSID